MSVENHQYTFALEISHKLCYTYVRWDIGGHNSIPDDWKDYIGDKIITISIERGVVHHLPDNCSELTDRVFRLVPHMLFSNYSDTVICNEATDFGESDIEKMFSRKATQALCDTSLNSFRIDFNYASCVVSYDGNADIKPNGKKLFICILSIIITNSVVSLI